MKNINSVKSTGIYRLPLQKWLSNVWFTEVNDLLCNFTEVNDLLFDIIEINHLIY